MESAQAGAWEWDFGRGVLRVDPRWCAAQQLHPCPGPDHLAGWSRQLHPDDLPEFQRRCAALRAGEERFEAEYRMLRRDLRWVWVLQRGRIVERTPDGRAQRVCGMCIEIDDRKLAQVALAENEARHATALWGARAAYWRWQVSNAGVTVQSPQWFAMTGYTREQWESIPEPWFARIHPQDRADVERQIYDHVKGLGPLIEVEYRIRTATDEWKWMLTRGRAVEWDFEGRATCCIGVSLDVDAQKRTERSLRGVETALTAARGAMWDWDLRTRELRRSGFYHRMLGLASGSAPAGSPLWTARVHPEDLPAAAQALQAVVEGGQDIFESQYRLRHADGSWRWVLDRGCVCERHEDGTPARVAGFVVDVTGHAEAGSILRRNPQQERTVAVIAPGFSFEYEVDDSGRLLPLPLSEEAEAALGSPLTGLTAATGGLEGLVDEAHRPKLMALLRQVSGGRPASGELRVRTPDGAERWIEAGMVPVQDLRSGHGARVTGVLGAARDITPRKLTERALRTQIELTALVTRHHPDWLCLLDGQLRVRFINKPFGRYAPEDLIGHHILDIAPEDTRGGMARTAREVLASGVPAGFYLHFTRTGQPVCYEHRLARVISEEGEPFVAVALRDVTAQRREEAGQQALRRILEALVAATPEWLALFDRQLRCVHLNQPLRGLPVSSWIGASVEDFAPARPAERTRVREACEAVLRTGEPRDFEVMVSREPLLCVQVRARAVRDNGEITGVVASAQDVTALEISRERQQAQTQILETLAEGVVLWEVASGLITLANPAFERLLDVSPLKGQPLAPLLRLPLACRERFERAQREEGTGIPTSVAFACVRGDGSLVQVAGLLARLSLAGGPHGLLLLHEAGDGRGLERQIVEIARREAQRVGREVHEALGQDLTSIALRLRGAVAQLRTEGSPARLDVEEAIDLVNHAIEGARGLAHGLSPVSTQGLVAALQTLAAGVSERHGVRVTVHGDTGAFPGTSPAAAQVFRIVQEALSNVIRYSHAPSATVTLGTAGHTFEVRIEDSGRGLPPGEAGGPGIRLMRALAHGLDGQLVLQSDNSGTRVRLTCPLTPPPPPAAQS